MENKALLTAAFISVLLLLAVAGTQFVNLGRGNPYSNLMVVDGGHTAAPPNTEPPKITINNIWNSGNNVSIIFNVRIGESKSADNVSSMIITSVYYKADWQENNTYVYKYIPNPSNPSNINTEFSTTLHFVEIPEGRHTLTVYATERGSYYNLDPSNWPMFGTVYYYSFNKTGSSSVSFIIDTTPPSISVLTMENKTYDTSDVPLSFTVNEPVSQISYSLDEQDNVTIAGNTTLTGLSDGEHNLTVYATDEAGYVGASETVYFSLEVPEPQPEPETFPITLVIATVIIVAVVGAGLFVYFKKKERLE